MGLTSMSRKWKAAENRCLRDWSWTWESVGGASRQTGESVHPAQARKLRDLAIHVANREQSLANPNEVVRETIRFVDSESRNSMVELGGKGRRPPTGELGEVPKAVRGRG